MTRKRRVFGASLKAKVALAALSDNLLCDWSIIIYLQALYSNKRGGSCLTYMGTEGHRVRIR